MTKYCPSCGDQQIDEARFCKSCGAALDGPHINQNTHQENTQQFMQASEKSHTGLIIAGYVLAILIPLIGVIISVYLMTRDSQKAKRHGKYILIVAVIVWVLSILSIFH